MREQGYELTDEQWERIRPLLPPPARTGHPRADDRKNGILYVLRTGCAWKEMPREYGVCNGMAEVEEVAGGGVWTRIWQAFLSSLDGEAKLLWLRAFLDGSFFQRKKGGKRSGRPRWARGRSGCWWWIGTGFPFIFRASKAEVELVQETLERVWVRRRRGRPRKLVADKAYDCDRFRGEVCGPLGEAGHSV